MCVCVCVCSVCVCVCFVCVCVCVLCVCVCCVCVCVVCVCVCVLCVCCVCVVCVQPKQGSWSDGYLSIAYQKIHHGLGLGLALSSAICNTAIFTGTMSTLYTYAQQHSTTLNNT